MNVSMKTKPDGSSVGGGFGWRTSPSTITPLPTTYTQAYDNANSIQIGVANGGTTTRVAKKKSIGAAATIASTTFYLKTTGTPTGTLTAHVRKVSDSALVATSTTSLDVSTLTGSYVEYTFSFSSDALPNEALYFTVETATTLDSVYVSLTAAHDVFDESYYKGAWFDQITLGNAGSVTVYL